MSTGSGRGFFEVGERPARVAAGEPFATTPDYESLGYAQGDERLVRVPPGAISYPFAYERLSAIFDDPRTGQKIRSYFADEQIHISADIAFAIDQYVRATGDTAFLAEYGLEVVCEVARFFASRVTGSGNRYELRTVLGPDEYHERVDNNAYTNTLARESLTIALAAFDRVRASAIVRLSRARVLV